MNITIDTDPKDIPWIFKNRDLTIPSTQELHTYLTLLVNDDPEPLRFLYSKSQEYTKYNGANAYTFKRWLDKLKKDLVKTKL